MYKLAIIGFFALVNLCPFWQAVGQETDSTISIFRYADLGTPGKIILGEPFALHESYGIRESDGVIRIPMSYPGTAWMRVFTDSNGRVVAMYFSYNTAFDFTKSLANYTEDLGQPKQDLAEGADEVYLWQDKQTRFELVRRQGKRGTQHFSILSDLEHASSNMLSDLKEIDPEDISLTIADMLATTELWSIFSDKPSELVATITTQYPDLHPDTLGILSEVIKEHYAPLTLYSHVYQYMTEYHDDDLMTSLTEWLFDETAVRLRATVDEYKPPFTFEEYVSHLNEAPPEAERVRLIMRFVRANQVGAFFLGLDAATREAGNSILAVLPGKAALLPSPSQEEINEMTRNYELGAVVSFLWRFEPLTNEQIAQTVRSYETESGQWYVETYIEALLSALEIAGGQVVRQVSGLR